MGGFKRFFYFVFGLAGVLCLGALALPWVGPFQHEAAALMGNYYYYIGVQAALAITVLGLLVVLLRALLTPRPRKQVVIDKTGGDRITVTTAAISSQATHVVEDHGHFIAEKVNIATKGRNHVSVNVRVKPRRVVNVTEEGKRLHDDLAAGLATVCGDRVSHINLEFVEAEQPEPAQNVTIENLELPRSIYERAAQLKAEAADAALPPVSDGLDSTSDSSYSVYDSATSDGEVE